MGNARSGRRPKPTAMLRAAGSRVRRRGREPVYEPGAPPCPAGLRDDLLAVAAWEHFAGLLTGSKVLTTGHAAALANLASVQARLDRARAAHAAEGFPTLKVYHRRGDVFEKPHPLATEINKLITLQLRLLDSFGLTPASAPKVEALGAPPERSDFERFVGGA